MTETWREDEVDRIREQCKIFLRDRGLSITQAARMIPCSMLSPWLNRDYSGNNTAVAEKVAAWLARQELAKTATPRPTFVSTSISQRIHDSLAYCHIEREFGVIVGYVGAGKTMAIDEYVAREKDVVLCKLYDTHTPARVAEDLARAAGVPHPRGTMHGLLTRTVERLRDTGRLLLVDEAQFLSRRGIEAVRTIHDEAHIGVALVAMPRFYHGAINIGTELLAQIASRVGKVDVLPSPTAEDFDAMFRPRYPGLTDAIIARAHAVTAGDARKGDKLLKRASLIARAAKRAVREDDLAKAHATLYRIDTHYRLRSADHAPAPDATPEPAPLRALAAQGAR